MITMNDLYVSEDTGDLQIDIMNLILIPMLKDEKFVYTEQNLVVNFGLILM